MVDTIFTMVILVLSIIYLFMTRDLKIGTLTHPGSGFLPLIAGSGAAITSFIILVSRLKENLARKDTHIDINWKKFGAFFAGLIIYVFALKILGYEIATFAIMLYLFKVCGVKGWVAPVVIALGISFGFYYIFSTLLGVTLP
ncbi:tripartite tricarboxylate transporter TctB family protein [Neomoorella humiferrea]|uniref:Tripartite tricarboxylate transporter TctB family protein n=1 Tax=Neomoorella humiferrea TaxID=676965 RepID=A0A2T0AT71_9FIRM|nr:tripartite tricarboxylate transporter TctB family protein [Moorella humiferrea]PRR73591.1 Tripartite tricarboxylate transporter TctB family protein [Moorella humiferrea]